MITDPRVEGWNPISALFAFTVLNPFFLLALWLSFFVVISPVRADELWWIGECAAHPEHCGMSKRHAVESCRHFKAWHWTEASCH